MNASNLPTESYVTCVASMTKQRHSQRQISKRPLSKSSSEIFYLTEPQMCLDGFNASCCFTANAFAHVATEKFPKEVFGVLCHVRGEPYVPLHDLLHRLFAVIADKWRLPSHHVVQQRTERPPVYLVPMTLQDTFDTSRRPFCNRSNCYGKPRLCT